MVLFDYKIQWGDFMGIKEYEVPVVMGAAKKSAFRLFNEKVGKLMVNQDLSRLSYRSAMKKWGMAEAGYPDHLASEVSVELDCGLRVTGRVYGDMVLVCELVDAFREDDWSLSVPEYTWWIAQAVLCAFPDKKVEVVAVSMNGIKRFVVDADVEAEHALREKVMNFLDMVGRGVFSSDWLVGSEDEQSAIQELSPEAKDTSVCLEDLDEKISQLREIEKEIDSLAAQADAIKNEIRLRLGEAMEGYSHHYEISWKPVSSRRLDTKIFKKEQAELYNKYTVVSTSRRLGIKPIL